MFVFTCLLCQSNVIGHEFSASLRDAPDGDFRVVRCGVCGHVQLTPVPTQEEDHLFYAQDKQAVNLYGQNQIAPLRRNAEHDLQRRYTWVVQTHTAPASVLDVGCGYGFFVDMLSQNGYRALGMDVSAVRLAYAREAAIPPI